MFLKMSCLQEESVLFQTSNSGPKFARTSVESLRRHRNHLIGKKSVRNTCSNTGFERCFSTRSGVEFGAGPNNNMTVAPILDLLPDCRAQQTPFQKTNLLNQNSKLLSPVTSSMSVSYIVGGFVSSKNKTEPNSPNLCNIFDVLVTNFQSKDSVNSSMKDTNKELVSEACENFSPGGIKSSPVTIISKDTMNPKRTYADVAKGLIHKSNVQESEPVSAQSHNMNSNDMYSANGSIQKPNFLRNNMPRENSLFNLPTRSCSTFSVINGHHHVKSQSCVPTESSSNLHGKCDFFNFKDLIPCAQHTILKLPMSSSIECHRINRTLSECSVDSDDSFVVFQNEDDAVYDSLSDDDSNSDDSNEVDNQDSADSLSPPVPFPEKKSKKVSFKPDDQLVEVHNMIKWDYAHRAARVGPWETYARDRARFENRIRQAAKVLSPILEPSHRAAIYHKRFLERK